MNWLRRWWQKLRLRWVAAKAPGRFLCDSCLYDYPHACHRRERPNATVCPDYKPR